MRKLLLPLGLLAFVSPRPALAQASPHRPSTATRTQGAKGHSTAHRIFTNEDFQKRSPRKELPELHFAIALPRGWPAYKIEKNEFTIPCPDSDEPKCGLAVVVNSLPAGEIPNQRELLDHWRKKILDEGAAETFGWRDLWVEGLPAGEHQIAFADPKPGRMHLVYVLFTERRRLYIIGLRTPSALFDRYAYVFEEFLASFEPLRD